MTKVDEDYPDNKLTGATFEVYKDVNGDGKLDDGDELIGTLTETTTGIYEMKELLYGKYLVRETKAPEGFELDKGVYSVFIEKDETTYEVENKVGVGFINTATISVGRTPTTKGVMCMPRHLMNCDTKRNKSQKTRAMALRQKLDTQRSMTFMSFGRI